MKTLADLAHEIEAYIVNGHHHIDPYAENKNGEQVIWVIKYFSPKYLRNFLKDPRLRISDNRGFTWGDAVYVAPLLHPYSSMMYGRAGVVGYVKLSAIDRVFRADMPQGLDLYIQWITHQKYLYTMLATTMHADYANQRLRNLFRTQFKVDIVIAAPDQSANRYTDTLVDRWFAVSEWTTTSSGSLALQKGQSNIVKECKWLAIVGEEFEPDDEARQFHDLFGSNRHQMVTVDGPSLGSSVSLRNFLVNQHQNATAVPTIAFIRTDQ